MSDENEFDEIFFGSHGVGQLARDPNHEAVAHTLDPTEPTLSEREFCRELLKGSTKPEAYRKIFDSEGSVPNRYLSAYAARILKRERVAKYYYQLQQELSELAEETLPSLIAELNEDRQLARDMGQPASAIAAVKAKASLLGLESASHVSNTININLTDEQKKALLGRIGRQTGLVKSDEAIDAEFEDVSG